MKNERHFFPRYFSRIYLFLANSERHGVFNTFIAINLTSSSSLLTDVLEPYHECFDIKHPLMPALGGAGLSLLHLISWRNERGHALNETHLGKAFLKRWGFCDVLELAEAEAICPGKCCQSSGVIVQMEKVTEGSVLLWTWTPWQTLGKAQMTARHCSQHLPFLQGSHSCSGSSRKPRCCSFGATSLLNWSLY